MIKNINKILAVILSIFLMMSFVGCKKNPENGSDEYSYIYVYDDGTSSDKSKDEDKTSSDKKGNSSNKETIKVEQSNSGSSSSDKKSESERPSFEDKNNKSRYKDLKGRKIVYVAWWDGTDRTSAAGKTLTMVEQKFNCKFEEKKMSDYKALYTSILAGNPIADIFCPYDTDTLALANKGMLTPLDTLSNFNFDYDCWDPATTKRTTLNGHVYGMCRNQQIRYVLMYNKDMFKSNNWEDLYTLQNQDKLSWDKMFEIMQNAASKGKYGLVPLYDKAGLGIMLLGANGVEMISRVGTTAKFVSNLTASNPAVLDSLETLKKWSNLENAMYDSTDAGWDTGRSVFASGKAAMAVVDYQMFSEVYSNANFTIGMCFFPHGKYSKNNLVLHNAVETVIPAGVKDPNDVALFWDVFRDELKESYYSDEIANDNMPDPSVSATLTGYVRAIKDGKYFETESSNCITDQFTKIANGETTPASAIQTISQKIDAELADKLK